MRYDRNGNPIPPNATHWDGVNWVVPPSSYADIDIPGMRPGTTNFGNGAVFNPAAAMILPGLAQSYQFGASPEPMGNSIRRMLNDLYGGQDSHTPMPMTEFHQPGKPKPPTFDELYAQQRQRTIDRYGGLDKAIADLRERGGLGKRSRYYSGWERPKSGKERVLDTWITLHPSEKSIPRKSDDEILAMLDQDWRKNADQELSIQARRSFFG